MDQAVVHLGVADRLDECDRFRLRSHYMPLGKIGGKPSWLSYHRLPTAVDLACSKCDKQMIFLIQIYATSDTDPKDAFHRSLFVFICRNANCSTPNDATNIRIFRCQLPRINAFYASDAACDPDVDGDIPPRIPIESYSQLCEMCGSAATKKCARCEHYWYCSKEHQVAHWHAAHKSQCGVDGNLTNVGIVYTNTLVFPEFGIAIEREPLAGCDDVTDSEDEDSGDDSEHDEQRRMAEYHRYVGNNMPDDNIAVDIDDDEDESKSDAVFDRFQRRVRQNPQQILRYQRGGVPLWATINDGGARHQTVPDCELCGAPRQFELQLMPHLVALIDVDVAGAKSVDWATVAVFTCSASCTIPDYGYAREFAIKQDFE